ncbi:DUF2515 family protein [Anaerobacillus isosaccharinicus]|uniref:DUF2515 family protein n=1 Tax=Anaerobacillus isosaccharinicus TaxID=1532552 RepID=A0A1S2KXY3_9BACI|nr:DUF2515 family protein [Anaerobacillus isosaccharinicus]MBA5585905.1 DUF2515 family protein [Anaerobacillus isosaccharinicus]QOY35806.1 DUF2515 family protein [Anaerobacillus isosaccharinicus]
MAIYSLSREEKEQVDTINKVTMRGNLDNISRTVFYDDFYLRNKEIIWAYLASFVSRNAGWNMTDLEGEIFRDLIPKRYRDILYLTYERANWLIFLDAYPQLLIYEKSKQTGEPLFHLLKFFHVSKFMVKEWERFWFEKDIERLCKSLIINEQHVIQKPVIEAPFYHDKVFGSLPFVAEEKLHFSTVFFPTLEGELFGYSVHGFKNVKNRIDLGKRLTKLLFHSREQKKIRRFASEIEHTGSRYDYEKYVKKVARKRTPTLRSVYPVIHHHRSDFTDWYNEKTAKKIAKYYREPDLIEKYDLTDWYYQKQNQLQIAARLEQWLLNFIK